MIKKQYTLTISTGFARPSTLLVSMASKFASEIFLEYKCKSINLKNSSDSIMEMMSLGVDIGSKINLKAEGIDEHQALNTMETCLSKKMIIAL
ncbi:MAG: HPr family phosphocarrier protein [Bacillota bacterium]